MQLRREWGDVSYIQTCVRSGGFGGHKDGSGYVSVGPSLPHNTHKRLPLARKNLASLTAKIHVGQKGVRDSAEVDCSINCDPFPMQILLAYPNQKVCNGDLVVWFTCCALI